MAADLGRDDHQRMLENLEHMGGNMNGWEESFVASARERFDRGEPLTDRQAETLERIYQRRMR